MMKAGHLEVNSSTKKEVIMAGTGGRGVLLAGEILLHAAAAEYEHVAYFPSYGTSMRGGHVECTVILSNERIGSPLLPQADVVVIFDNVKLSEFEGRVRPGGMLILESTGLTQEPARSDIKVTKIPAVEIANTSGDIRTANLILLGAYVAATNAIAPALIERRLEQQLVAKKQEKSLPANLAAFRRGLEIA